MPSGIVRQISGKIAQAKSKGKAFVAELNRIMSPDAICKEKPETQPISKKKK